MTQEDLFQAKSTKEKSGYSQVDTHANPSRSREIAEEKKTLATSFRTSIELLNKQDPLIVFSKMFMGMSQWDLTRYSLKWKGSTTIRGNLLFRLQVSERDTKETDSGSSVKMWATPNTMDALPPRSEEGTKKLQEGHRKGRKRPSNLREQVDKKTMALYETNYPTPTTKGFGHASEGMTLIFRKKVERGEMTEQEAQAMMNGVTLRPPRMKGVEISDTECRFSETQLQRESRILQEEIEGRQTSGLGSQDFPRGGRRQTQCELDGVANGLSYWMDEPRGVPRVTVEQKNRPPQRLRMLGNAIVPQIAMQIGLALKEDMKNG